MQAELGNTGILTGAKAKLGAGAQGWGAGINSGMLRAGLLVFVGYYLGAQLGLALTFHPHPVSVMWPPNSILLAALLLSPVRTWWFLLVCALPAHLISEVQGGVPLRMVLCWFLSNCSEALIGAGLTRFLAGSTANFARMRGIGTLFLCGGLIGPFLSSFVDAEFVALNQWGNQEYWVVWRMRFFSNVFTALTLTPAIVIWATGGWQFLRSISKTRWLEAVVACAGLLTASLWTFCWQKAGPDSIPSLLYVPLPFLLWAAVRFAPNGTSAGTLCIALLAIWGAVHGYGPFGSHSPQQNALAIQIFFIVVAIMFMFLTASIGERARAEERFTKAFRASPDAMLISRLSDGHIIEVNERWEKMLGYRKSETLGRAITDLNIYTSRANREAFLAVTETREHFQGSDVSLLKKNGEQLYAMISGDVEEIGGEPCWIFIIRDVTDRKRAEEAQQNLAHLTRVTTLGELGGSLAHELNQPLTAILSNAQAATRFLDMDPSDMPEVRRILKDIVQEDRRAGEIILRMRGMLRKEEARMLPQDLNEIVVEVLGFLRSELLIRNVTASTRLAPNLPSVQGDHVRLQQVLLNLIVNACEAMGHTPASKRIIVIETQEAGEGLVQASVLDHGPGFPSRNSPQMFEPFRTTKPNGLGLGLPICRSIVESHGGRLWVENGVGEGAIVRFTLKTEVEVTA